MNIIENAISLVAPHRCIICGFAGELICSACRGSAIEYVPSRCYRCHSLTRQSTVCRSCRSSVPIGHVWVAVQYDKAAKELLRRLKFERAKDGAATAAKIIHDILPELPPEIIVCHIPTANNRIRSRGYDQSELIAKSLCGQRNWDRGILLQRLGKSRQVGAGRKERFRHLEKALKIKTTTDLGGKHILLIDDVTTTGATLETAAKVLKAAGAEKVDAAVFAQP